MPQPAPLRPRVRRGGIIALVGLAVALRSGALQAQPAGPLPLEEGYSLLRAVDLPVSASFNRDGVPYDVDNAGALKGEYSMVAYRLILEDQQGDQRWVWVSMRAFTDQLALLGLPATATGAHFQRPATDLRVITNVPGLGTDAAMQQGTETGWIEFWPGDYTPANIAKVPGASDTSFDMGDSPTGGGNYGSFQIHVPSRATTIMAYNHWGLADSAAADIGIGNNPLAATGAGHQDWTFAGNAGTWATRRLEVWVYSYDQFDDADVSAPSSHQVFQRDAANQASFTLAGEFAQPIEAPEWSPLSGQSGEQEIADRPWYPLENWSEGGAFSTIIDLPAGNWWLDVRAQPKGGGDWLRGRVQAVGVGDIYLTAGQSNSANHGLPPQWMHLLLVAAGSLSMDPGSDLSMAWRIADDPQPIATGSGGSPWPAMGQALAFDSGIPVGFVSVGWGGTAVSQWQPGGNLYPRIERALKALGPGGLRAVLWHQGESDAQGGTTREAYQAALTNVIQASRRDAGFEVPWLVAQAAYLPGVPQAQIDEVLAAQRALPAAVPSVYSGPLTDDLIGDAWRYDGVHFNGEGLMLHGQRWAEALRASGVIPPRPEPTAIPSLTPTELPTATEVATATMPRLALPWIGR